MNPDNNQALFNYLRDVSTNSQFTISVLKILIEESRTAHHKRWKKVNQQNKFKVGGVMKDHIEVRSKAEIGEVNKISYQARGPFQVLKVLVYVSYESQRYKEPKSSILNKNSTDLYLLAPDIFPRESFGTMDVNFVNYLKSRLVSPLHK